MKMLKPEIEFIEFDASDVIATSDCPIFTNGSILEFPYQDQTPTKTDDKSESQEYDDIEWNTVS